MRAYFLYNKVAKTSEADLSPLFYLYIIEKNPTTGKPPQHIKQNCNCSQKNAGKSRNNYFFDCPKGGSR
jgi:hypothetical protein